MADGSFPGLVSKDRSVNSLTNEIFVGVTDGTEQLLITAAGEANVLVTNGAAGAAVNIQDGGNSITVDGTVAISGTVTVDAVNLDIRDLVHPTDSVSIGDGGSIILDLAVTDTAAGATDNGLAAMAIRDDALTTLTPVDGDYVGLRTTSTGALWVTTTAGASDPSNVVLDDSAYTVGTGSVGVVGYLADETTPDSVDEGDVGAARMTLDRKQLFVGVDSTTDSQRWTIDAGGALQVDVTDQVPGVGATNLGKAVDSVGGATDTGVASLALRDDVLTALTPADGDYVRLRTDSIGALWVRPIEEGTSGTEIQDYNTTSALASDTTANHDTTAANTTFLLKSVIFSGSGSVKAEIQAGPLASLATVAVGFLTGRQGDTQQLFFDPAVEATGTTPTIRVILTNRQGSASDVYSTVIGNDV